MYLKWAPILYYCHKTPFENSHTRQTCRKIAARLFLPARACDYSRVGPQASTCEKVFFSTFSLSGFFELERNWIWLASVRRWAVSWVTDYFFIQFYVSAIFHNNWTPEMKRWKERLCIISTVFNWHSTSVSSTEFKTELNTICTVRDSTTRLKVDWLFSLNNSTDYSVFTIRLHDDSVLTIPLYDSAYNSADNFVWQIRIYKFDLQFGWPKWVKRFERPSSDSTVVQSGCLVPRPSMADVIAESDARMGRVTRGKDSFWWLVFGR